MVLMISPKSNISQPTPGHFNRLKFCTFSVQIGTYCTEWYFVTNYIKEKSEGISEQDNFKEGWRPWYTSLTGCCSCLGLRWRPGRWHRSQKTCSSSDSRSRFAGWVEQCDTADRAPSRGSTSRDAWSPSSPTDTPTTNQPHQHHEDFQAKS